MIKQKIPELSVLAQDCHVPEGVEPAVALIGNRQVPIRTVVRSARHAIAEYRNADAEVAAYANPLVSDRWGALYQKSVLSNSDPTLVGGHQDLQAAKDQMQALQDVIGKGEAAGIPITADDLGALFGIQESIEELGTALEQAEAPGIEVREKYIDVQMASTEAQLELERLQPTKDLASDVLRNVDRLGKKGRWKVVAASAFAAATLSFLLGGIKDHSEQQDLKALNETSHGNVFSEEPDWIDPLVTGLGVMSGAAVGGVAGYHGSKIFKLPIARRRAAVLVRQAEKTSNQ